MPGNSEVLLYLSEIPEQEWVAVPDFMGLNRQQAEELAGKHGIYSSAGERAKIRKWIEANEYQAITELIDSAKGHPCIFFDDDIFYYHKQQRVAADVVKLIEEDI